MCFLYLKSSSGFTTQKKSQSLYYGSQGHMCHIASLSDLLLSHCLVYPSWPSCQLPNMPGKLSGPWYFVLSVWNTLPSDIHISHAFSSWMSWFKIHSLNEAFPDNPIKNCSIPPTPSLLTTFCWFSFLHSIYTIGYIICFTYLLIVYLPVIGHKLHEHRNFYQFCALFYL